MDIKNKLKQFSNVAFIEARKLRDDKLKKINEKYNKTCDDFEDEIKKKYYNMLKERKQEIFKNNLKTVLQEKNELKLQLFNKRSEAVDNLFCNIKEKIQKFIKSENYIEYLLSIIEKYAYNYEEYQIIISKSDAHLKDDIQKMLKNEIIISENDFLGGLKIKINKNCVLDCSFLSKFEDEKQNFNMIEF